MDLFSNRFPGTLYSKVYKFRFKLQGTESVKREYARPDHNDHYR